MVRQLLIAVGAVAATAATAQVTQIPWPDLIAETKKSVVPVLARDTSWARDSASQGTAVMIGDKDSARSISLALTCAHVVAATFDTNDLPKRPASEVVLGLGSTGGPATWVPAKVVYFDPRNDLALCRIAPELLPKGIWQRMQPQFTYIQPSHWRGVADIREGDQVLYCGYPMGEGIGGRSFPLSRTGLISQVVPGQRWFLIDGFVQSGHSGSPVFLVKEKGRNIPPVWDVQLIGVARSYPGEFKNVYRKVRFVPSDTLFASLNPGFTHVAPLDSLFPILAKLGLKPRE
jgi:hypothetical protein